MDFAVIADAIIENGECTDYSSRGRATHTAKAREKNLFTSHLGSSDKTKEEASVSLRHRCIVRVAACNASPRSHPSC